MSAGTLPVKILVVDDDESIHVIIRGVLSPNSYRVISAYDGEAAVRLAHMPGGDIVLLDISIPGMDGWNVLKELRKDTRTRAVPIIMLTGDGNTSSKVRAFDCEADDYITKPFDIPELRARVENVLRKNARARSASPLTGLPGSPSIEDDVTRRIREGRKFTFLYIDIDHFKSYNDAYGFRRGDHVIKKTAGLLQQTMKSLDNPAGQFLGHIGGDDFAIVMSPQYAEKAAAEIISRFDGMAPSFYNSADRANGYVHTVDRSGLRRKFPLISLSIAAAVSENRRLLHYAGVVDIVTAIKKNLKSRADRTGSAYARDRRRDW